MIEIKYNQNVITRLKEAGFFPDTMFTAVFTLQGLANGQINLLDLIDDYSTSKRMAFVYYDLVRRGLIKESPTSDKSLYELTEEGTAFINELNVLGQNIVKDDTDQWIQEWIELFPKGVKSGGKLLRSDAKSCLIKMKKFRKDYGYDRDTIFKATEQYLAERELQNYDYTKCAVYFIYKQGEGSTLAERCENLKETPQEAKTKQIITTNYTGLV